MLFFYLKNNFYYTFFYKFCFILSERNNLVSNNEFCVIDFFNFFSINNVIVSHRLDKEVSGILYIAKNKNNLDNFKKKILQKIFFKYYLCLNFGFFLKKHVIKNNLVLTHLNKKNTYKNFYSIFGNKSLTLVKFLDFKNNFTIFFLYPITGKTHQLRYQLLYKGTPIINDGLYYLKNKINIGLFLFLFKMEINFLNIFLTKINLSVPPFYIFFLLNKNFNLDILFFNLELN